MERLNLREQKPFDFSRQYNSTPTRARFICVAEGPTEESYILGIRNNKAKLQIKNDVSIEVIPKEVGQESYSHPLQLVEACLYKMGRRDKEGKDMLKEEGFVLKDSFRELNWRLSRLDYFVKMQEH